MLKTFTRRPIFFVLSAVVLGVAIFIGVTGGKSYSTANGGAMPTPTSAPTPTPGPTLTPAPTPTPGPSGPSLPTPTPAPTATPYPRK